MPEGHTLHRLARDLAELVGPEVTATSPQGRFPAERVDGQRLNGVEAYGRPLLVDTAAGDSVHVHLGLRGKWLRFAPLTGPGLPQVRLRLAVPAVAWDLIAPSTCELLDAVDDGRIITVEATTGGRCRGRVAPVHKQERCYDGGTATVTGMIDGRTTYACPRCQPGWAG